MNQPWIYMCSPSRSTLPPPSPPAPSRSSQCTRSERLSHASNLGPQPLFHDLIGPLNINTRGGLTDQPNCKLSKQKSDSETFIQKKNLQCEKQMKMESLWFILVRGKGRGSFLCWEAPHLNGIHEGRSQTPSSSYCPILKAVIYSNFLMLMDRGF